MTENLVEYLCRSVETVFQNRTNLWEASPFEKLTFLTNDERGKWGESTIKFLIETLTSYEVVWDGDKNTNQTDGTYDILINEKRTEIKTANGGSSNPPNWQHENIIKENVWDKLVFLDIDFFGFYVTVFDFEQIDFDKKHPVFGRTPTLRQSQTDKYKFDFGLKQQQLGIQSGFTCFHSVGNHNADSLSQFLIDKFQ